MSMSLSLRWSGRYLGSGRSRVTHGAPQSRHLSFHHTRSTPSLRSRTSHRSPHATLKPSVQLRSFSLLGWGSKKAGEDPSTFASPAAAQPAPPTLEAAQKTGESVRTVKASHATSDAPALEPQPPPPVHSGLPESLPSSAPDALQHTPPTAELTSIPEGLGYLKDVCGLDYGWGPTGLMEFLLEHLHITAGLSWSASIVALAVMIRAVIFPAAVRAAGEHAKMREMQPMLKPLTEKYKAAAAANDRAAMMATQQEIKLMKQEFNVKLSRNFLPVILQMPLGFGAFFLLRNAGNLPVPAFTTEHFLWLTDISVSDPLYILPVATAAVTYWNLSSGLKQSPDAAGIMRSLSTVFPVVTFAFLLFQPAATQIYFFVNGILSQISITVLNNPAFRRSMKLPPVRSPAASAASTARPAKMNFARKTGPTAEPVPTPAERSIIDKGVDYGKARAQTAWKNTLGGIGDTWKDSAKTRMEKDKAERERRKTAKYEAQRRQDIEMERLYRNAGQKNP